MFCIIRKLHGILLDFTQAFLQVELKHNVYIEVPAEYNNNDSKYVLKLFTNIYRLSDASLTWYEYYTKDLID